MFRGPPERISRTTSRPRPTGCEVLQQSILSCFLASQVMFGICAVVIFAQLQSCACFILAAVNSISMATATGLKCQCGAVNDGFRMHFNLQLKPADIVKDKKYYYR